MMEEGSEHSSRHSTLPLTLFWVVSIQNINLPNCWSRIECGFVGKDEVNAVDWSRSVLCERPPPGIVPEMGSR